MIEIKEGNHKECRLFKLEDVKRLFKGVVIDCGGYEKESAEETINKGEADLIAFAKKYITNPDLVERW